MFIDYIIIFLLSSIISGNNSTLIVGPLSSSGLIKKNYTTIFVSIFITLGFMMEGGKMLFSISYITSMDVVPLYILVSSLILFIIFSFISVPLSAGMVFSGSIMGFALYYRSLSYSVLLIFISWVASFLISITFGYVIYKRISRGKVKVTGSRFIFFLFIFSSAFLSYTLGSNTLGFLYAISPDIWSYTAIISGIFFGTFLLKGFTYKTIKKSIVKLNRERAVVSQLSSSMVVEAFTQAHLPVSITQGVLGSLIGTGLSKGYNEVNLSKVNQLILSWVLTPLLSAFLVMVMIVISPGL
ncbi:MAG: inorganic phosphate transporter [Thermoplasmata archaeon]